MEQGKIMEAEVPTVWVGATPTGLTAPPPRQPPSKTAKLSVFRTETSRSELRLYAKKPVIGP